MIRSNSIDLENEHLLSMSQAATFLSKKLPGRRGGRPIHTSTLHRWTTRGLKGVRLEVMCAGGTRFTSIPAIERFFVRLGSDVARDTSSESIASSDRSRRIAQAEKELAAAKF